MNILWSPEAIDDLTLLRAYIAEDNPAAAQEVALENITSWEAQIIIESWRQHYNTVRPHASLGYRPPAPEVFVPALSAWPARLRRSAPPATLALPPALN